METKLKKISYWAGVSAVGIVLGLSLQFTRAWVEPTVPAPGGSIGAPINTGSTTQTKSGTLNVINNSATGLVASGVIGVIGEGTGFGGRAFYAAAGSSVAYTMSSTTPPAIGIADTGTKSYHLGNVGIGTTDPAQKLHVNGNATVSGNMGVGTTSNSAGLKLDIEGKVGATEYCDSNGANCKPATSLGCSVSAESGWSVCKAANSGQCGDPWLFGTRTKTRTVNCGTGDFTLMTNWETCFIDDGGCGA